MRISPNLPTHGKKFLPNFNGVIVSKYESRKKKQRNKQSGFKF